MTTGRARVARGRGRRTPRRPVEWFDNIINETITSASQQVEDLSSELADLEKKGASIARIIINMTCVLTTAAGTGGVLTFGICMVENDAVAAGVSPEPSTETDKPGWMWRTRESVFSSDLNDRAQVAVIKEDLKTGRRFRGASDNLMLIIDSGTLSNPVNIDGWIRVLIRKN